MKLFIFFTSAGQTIRADPVCTAVLPGIETISLSGLENAAARNVSSPVTNRRQTPSITKIATTIHSKETTLGRKQMDIVRHFKKWDAMEKIEI